MSGGDARNAGIKVGIDKDADVARVPTQDVVGASTDNDAGIFLSKVFDDVALGDEEAIIDGNVIVDGTSAAVYGRAHSEGIKQTVSSFFICRVENIGVETAFLGSEGDEFLIIEGETEGGGYLFPNLTAAAPYCLAMVRITFSFMSRLLLFCIIRFALSEILSVGVIVA